jgi:FMN-dependent oxidoreductase (nitrilotriacetate monooxygenase family)
MKQMKLLAFLMQAGCHLGGWRHPDAWATGVTDPDYFRQLAQTAERGKFDAVFFADVQGYRRMASEDIFSRTEAAKLDPLTLLAAMAMVTKNVGLVGTASTSYNDPYSLARRIASVDHLSRGRLGWNIVTSTSENEAHNFGRDAHFGHAERYARAAEFVDVCCGLWDTWDEGAMLADKASGVFVDTQKFHGRNHQGENFSVSGPMTTPRSPQGRPVLVQAGASDTGRKFATDVAEVIFTSHPSIKGAAEFYADMKARAAEAGRDPDGMKILPAITPIVAASEDEARALQRQLDDLIDPVLAINALEMTLGNFDLSPYPLDGPLPDIPETTASKSGRERVMELAKKENLTIRQVAQRISAQRTSTTVVGTGAQVADVLEAWLHGNAADGFVISPPYFPGGLDSFVDLVVPELQKRGSFRKEYEGSTLRANLGLPEPANRWAGARDAAPQPETW